MTTLNYLYKVIKQPGYVFNKKFLGNPINSITTARKIMGASYDLFESVRRLTNDKIENIKEHYVDIQNNQALQKNLDEKYKEYEKFFTNENLKRDNYFKANPMGRINREGQNDAGIFLYLVVRSLEPEVIVETGVNTGESSTYILQALEDNKKGKLFSIDLPPSGEEGRNYLVLSGKTSGWIIPDNLRHMWELNLGPSQDLLPPLLEKLKTIDIFFHDSLHTYDHMLFEYESSWKYLKEGGVLLSDDIVTLNNKGHSPFVDFAEKKGKEMAVFRVLGGVRK